MNRKITLLFVLMFLAVLPLSAQRFRSFSNDPSLTKAEVREFAATASKDVTTVPTYTGADEQLWRIEQLIDGTFRIMPKAIPGQDGINKNLVLYSAGDSTPTLAEYDFSSDNSKWNFRNH